MTSRRGQSFGGGRQFGGEGPPPLAQPAPSPSAGPVRPVRLDDDSAAQLVRSPVARITEPQPVRVRPELDGDVARYTALGLAYQPHLSQAHARVVATRLAEWSYEDPELRALIEDDFTKAVTSAGDSWWMREDSVSEALWSEAVGLVEAVAGSESATERRRLSEERDLAAMTGAVDPAVRVAEKQPQSKEQWSLGSVALTFVNAGALTNPLAFFKVIGDLKETENLAEAQSQVAAVAEATRAVVAETSVVRDVSPEMVFAEVGRRLFEDGEAPTLEAGMGLADMILGSLSDGERTRLLTDVRSMTSEELVEEWTPDPPDGTAIGSAIGATVRGALDVAQTWDAAIQSLGIAFLDLAINDRFAGDVGGDGGISEGGPIASLFSEGFDAFRSDFEAMKQGGIASYYGMDPNSALGGWFNLGSSIVFDPTTWIVPGGAQAAKRAAKMMSSAEGAEEFLRKRMGRHLVREIISTDNPIKLAPAVQGMSGDARLTLRYATDPSIVQDVIRNEIVNGTYMANGPALGSFHESILGAGDLARRISDRKAASTLTELLRHQPANRAVSVGETSFLDDATELIVARFPNDPDKAGEAMDAVYRRFSDFRGGSEALLNERTLFADQLRSQSVSVAKSVTAEVRRVPQVRAALADVNVRLRQLDTEAAALSRRFDEAVPIGDEIVEGGADLPARLADLDREITALTNQRESLEMWANRFGGQYDEWRGARADLLKQRQTLRRANLEAAKPRSRASLSQWYDEFMSGWADDIGVPRDDAGEIMWGEVTGRTHTGGASENVARQAPFGVEDDVARALGFGDTGSQHWLPATPYEMAIYNGAKNSGNLSALRLATAAASKGRTVRSLDFLNRLWAVNLLLNPLNAAKAHIEDVVKFNVAGASPTETGRALFSVLPRVGADSPRSAQFVRQSIAGLETRRSAWEVVGHGEKGHFEASRRWLEGTLLQHDGFRVWARSVAENDPAIWNQWWDDVGKLQARTPVISVPGSGGVARALDADTAASSMQRVIDELANLSSNPAEFRSTLTRLAASGSDTVPEAIARMAGPVPIERGTRSGVMGTGFDLLYGAPGRARGGVFFEHFNEQAMSVLEARWSGRIIDDQLDLLVKKGFASSVEEAQWLLAIRSPQVDDMLRQMGMVTRGYLEQTAAGWAGKHAQSLMYLGGASSIGGKFGTKFAPFAPAQFDFIRWWSRQITAGTDLALTQPVGAFAERVGAALEKAGATRTGGALARAGENLPSRGLPLNARIMARWSHLVAQSGQTEREDRSGLNPISLISNWTFLPVDFSDTDNFLVDFTPGLGPIPSWLINLLPPDHPVYKSLETVFPSLSWVGEQSEVSPESFLKYLLPSTTRSLTGVAGWVGRGAASVDALEGFTNNILGGMAAPIVDWQRNAYGHTDFFKQNVGDMLAENPGVVVGSEEYLSMVDGASRQAAQEANRTESVSKARRYVGMGSDYASDGQLLLHYRGLVDELDRLADAGIVGAAQRDQLKDWWPQIEGGEAPRSVRELFGNQAATLLFDLPDDQRSIIIAMHPELAVNMVSAAQAARDRNGRFVAPADLVRPDGRIDQSSPRLQGEEGAKLRERGFREGWFVPRPDHEVAADIFNVYQRARWDTLRNLWEMSTGRAYGDGMTKQLERTTFTFTPEQVAMFDRFGVAVPQSVSGLELREAIRGTWSAVSEAQKVAERAGNTSPDANPFWAKIEERPDYAPLWEEVEAVRDRLDDPDVGVTTIWEWPEQAKAKLRERIAATVATDPKMLADYDRYMRPALGPLDWEPPQPPPVSGLEKAIEVPSRFVSVEDGDTVRLATSDGDIRVRIIGLNAPEQGQDGYSEAWDRLAAILDQAETITVGRYRSDLFPTVQDVDVNEQRIFGWLYVDGVPLYDPSVFSATNTRGAEVGGDVSNLVGLLAAERQRMSGGG